MGTSVSPWLWGASMVIRIQLAHLTLGFNLELYLPHELCMVYWQGLTIVHFSAQL
jgi:hypothetical protein